MNLRKRSLPPGWYPQSAERVKQFLEQIPRNQDNNGAIAVIAPHAGWQYSGHIAARALQSLKNGVETVIVIGGHLSAGMPPLFAEEDGVVTPLGNMEIDREFRDIIWKELGGKPDRYYDNTIEVMLPMIKYYFPLSRLIWLRLGVEIQSYDVGRIIAKIGASLNRQFVFVGSTDLTHYGINYDFAPHGTGRKALEWMKTVNDAAFIQAVISGDGGETLRRADTDRSSCSAGAVLACMGYAQSRSASGAVLLSYSTSADTPAIAGAVNRPVLGGGASKGDVSSGEDGVPDSFVGYAAMAWYPG
jgi:AmmeMemoRadiSam system protein B